MSANPQLQDKEDHFDPALWMAALYACPASLAAAENGRMPFADRAFGMTLEMRSGSELRGRFLSDGLPHNTRDLDLWETEVRIQDPTQIEALVLSFEGHQRAFQVYPHPFC